MASKLCDSCKSATATLFCRPDSAFLCSNCDSKIHAANKLASRHARVLVCEVCEQAPAHVTCKADAAALCVTCDRDIHSANPLSRRHERVPLAPFYGSVKPDTEFNFLDDRYFSDDDGDAENSIREEAEAASWLLPNPKALESPDMNTGQYVFSEMDPYLDLDFGHVNPKMETLDHDQEQNSSATDGVVPVQNKTALVNDYCFDLDFTTPKAFPYGYNYNPHCLSHSVSSSSLDVGVVPDGSAMTDLSVPCGKGSTESTHQTVVVQLSSAEREARVLRYREKRKNRKFEKTIRYASRKAYAEVRPRIKGRFAKRSHIEAEADGGAGNVYGFGVVPSF
ncbi:B-box domain protein 5, CONSTANS-like 4 [Hibiscus trionum]|uniref:B-box domain protein 5, CONSTANS-like 4 n=1 Tax=Hibiscus trionum TaxID=183268 RepID=A0A9W7MSI8_HIBTR|nr:B-box domain protein 5, CONSTANS-like 4 [Hibiscus trionum]